MGLDAFVYCDCYEKGRLRESPPTGFSLSVEPDGGLGRAGGAGTLESDLAWDIWREEQACEHLGGILLHHRLGNITLIGSLRSELQRAAERFPILLKQVVYSGSHAGDFLPVETIPILQIELKLLHEFRCNTRKTTSFMARFNTQMSELATTALSVGKPIAF